MMILVHALRLLAAAIGSHTWQAEAPTQIDSPRIAALWSEIKAGHPEAVDDFWASIKGQVPLKEFIPPHNMGEAWMTVAWKGDESTTSVSLDGSLPPLSGSRSLHNLPSTNVWYWAERMPMDARFTYDFVVTRKVAGKVHTETVPDPLNPKTYLGDSVGEMWFAPAQPWITRLPGVPAGTKKKTHLFSTNQLEDRELTIYRPAGYKASQLHGVVVLFDGEDYDGEMQAGVTLDNLIKLKRIPPVMAVFVASNSPESPGKRRTRDLTCNDQFAAFVATELMPWLRRTYGVRLNPEQCVVAGKSLGGLGAAYVGFRYPNVFRRVIAQSGSFFWYPEWPVMEKSWTTQTGWLTSLYAHSERRRLRLWIETGTFEGDGVAEVRRFRDVCIAKSYPVSYNEFNGGHDRVNWRGSLGPALIALLGRR
jgi:enterochelin esterase family protein